MKLNTTIKDVQAVLDLVNRNTQRQFYAFYESGSARIAYPVGEYGGRQTVFNGTARECAAFAYGMRETVGANL